MSARKKAPAKKATAKKPVAAAVPATGVQAIGHTSAPPPPPPEAPMIYSAMVAVMRELPAVPKADFNQQQNFNYRGIDSIYNVLCAVAAKHGVFTTSEILEEQREERVTRNGGVLLYARLKIRYTFWAVDGSSVCSTVVGEGMDSGDKASNKAMAAAHKYALLQAYLVATEDSVDADGDADPGLAPPPVLATPEQFAALHDYRDAGLMSEGQVAWLAAAEDKITEGQADYVLSKLREKEEAGDG